MEIELIRTPFVKSNQIRSNQTMGDMKCRNVSTWRAQQAVAMPPRRVSMLRHGHDVLQERLLGEPRVRHLYKPVPEATQQRRRRVRDWEAASLAQHRDAGCTCTQTKQSPQRLPLHVVYNGHREVVSSILGGGVEGL